jgi:hypothetical protein
MRVVVDTNVPIVANGRADPSSGAREPSLGCRIAAIEFLTQALKSHRILLDLAGEIQKEYRTYLNPGGQPGVGDRFYQAILMSMPTRVERVDLPRTAEGDYVDFPADPELADFDPSDRKFAALARRARAPVANATDTDWLHHRVALERNGVTVDFVCGCTKDDWFVPGDGTNAIPGK